MTWTDAPTPPALGTSPAAQAFAAVEGAVASVVAAPPLVIRLAVGCLAAGGHLLVEDHPGLGKTTLAKSLANAVGLGFRRLQCTADLLPADVTGATILTPDSGAPMFRPGPIFTNVLMADELNRASPRAQSALLEAMEERQVTVDGTSYALPEPFFVLATQNPYDAAGTSPLPHGQRDRFLVRVSLGYPARTEMERLVAGVDPAELARRLPASVTAEDLKTLMAAVETVHVAPATLGYVLDLVEAVDRHPSVAVGPSPRAARALVRVSSALAVAEGRSYLSPADVQAAAGPVLAHRLLFHPAAELSFDDAEDLVGEMVRSFPVPLRNA
ncbi:MAG TPA: MoxR family ATPase [Acidimicrobiales bacterium]|nr:MoxR family ATPase [Acidimicrobiales bacterium]